MNEWMNESVFSDFCWFWCFLLRLLCDDLFCFICLVSANAS